MIIGISGKPGSGKTTISEHLQEKGFVELSLAGEIRKMICRSHGISMKRLREHPYKDQFIESIGCTPRALTIAVGKIVREQMGEDYLCTKLDDEINKAACDKFVVPDIRTVAQADWIKSKPGGILVRLNSTIKKSTYDIENELDDYVGFDILVNDRSSFLSFLKRL